MPRVRFWMVEFALFVLAASASQAQQPRTVEAFGSYVTAAETRITRARGKAVSFLQINALAERQQDDVMARLRDQEVVITRQGETPGEVPGGLIHDWVGTVLIPKATIAQVLTLVQDYDHSASHYSPDVMQSRLLSRDGDDFAVFLRLKKHKVITVVLDTEYAIHYFRLDPTHRYSFSRSTRVNEIADPGTPTEHAIPAGHDHGFMWRLNSYWAFEQVNEGVLIECEAISLTRDIPAGLGWMIGPFVNSIPRESLQFTLDATRKALAGKTTSTGTP